MWHYTGIPQIKPTFLDIAPSGIPPTIIPHSKGVKCGLIHSDSPLSWGNHRAAKRVGNQQKWDTLGPERSDVWKSLGELPEGPVMKSSLGDGLSLHLLPAL